MRIAVSFIYFIIGYLGVTTLASLHFLFNWKVRGQEGFDTTLGVQALKVNATQFAAFKNTKPFHPLYNIIVFPLVSMGMIDALVTKPAYLTLIAIGVLWALYSWVLDLVCWILIPHPWRLTMRELFVNYQPWISLAYLAIGISPLIGSMIG